jgi:hypothetical protein
MHAGFIVSNEYGALLSDPPVPNELSSSPGSVNAAASPKGESLGTIGRTLTSVAGVACLRASGGVGPQLISHVYGLLKARDEIAHAKRGSGSEGVGEQLGEKWLASPDGATWVISVVDRLVDSLEVDGRGGSPKHAPNEPSDNQPRVKL